MLGRELNKRQLAATGDEEPEAPKEPSRKIAKRATLAAGLPSNALKLRESVLFRPVRAIGSVTDSLPFAASKLGHADFLVASVQRGFQVFETEHLRLVYIGPRLNDKILAMTVVGEAVLTTLRSEIVIWNKAVEIGRLKGHTKYPTLLHPVGAAFLVSAAEEEVMVWQFNTIAQGKGGKADPKSLEGSPAGKLEVGADFGSCTAACHPPTYVNKVLLGSSTGRVALWNVRSHALVHEFKCLANKKDKSAVTVLKEVPNVLDLVAVGFESGRLCLIHAKEDRIITEFHQTQGSVQSITFRTGSQDEHAHMVSATPSGAFVVWDLERKRAHHVQEGAHFGPVQTVHFLPGQPLLVTSGCDNSIKMWIFDTPDGLPRLLRQRCGCPGTPVRMGFYGDMDDKELLVGGGGQGAGFVSRISFIRDQRNTDFAQKTVMRVRNVDLQDARDSVMPEGRVPPLVDMAFNPIRHFDWPAVVSAHEGLKAAFVWSASHETIGPKVMRPERPKDCAPVKAVAISSCGNYAVLGLANGALHRFNLQSLLHRGEIPKVKVPTASEIAAGLAEAKPKAAATHAHKGSVCGVAVTTGGLVVSMGGSHEDCTLKTWRLTTHEHVFTVPLRSASTAGSAVGGVLLRMQNDLVAGGLSDGSLAVVDLNGAAVVRRFSCGCPVTDAAFSYDGRWLAVTLRDGGLRVFDLLAARCVDSFSFARPALSVAFSPSTGYLLTSHQDSNALQVWANKYLFDPTLSAPLLRPEPKAPTNVDDVGGPDEAGNDAEMGEDLAEEAEEVSKVAEAGESIAEPLENGLMTLSRVPPAKWLATLHLDIVKERNKAAEPPKPLPKAPFFLPTALDGMTPRFAAPLSAEPEAEAAEKEAEKSLSTQSALDQAVSFFDSKVLSGERSVSQGLKFQQLLRKKKFDEALDFLRAQTPSGVHLAIEEIGPLASGTVDELRACLKMFQHHMCKAHLADELQVYLSIFLQAHGDELIEDEEGKDLCREVGLQVEKQWTDLSRRCQKVRCFLGLLTHTQSQW